MSEIKVPEGWKLVPVEPTEEMWGGLARDLMMWLDFDNKTVEALRRHLAMLNVEWPKWMDDEDELKGSGVPSKGTRATLIYKAMLAAAPAAPVVQSGPAVQKILDLILGECKYWNHRDEARRGGFAALYAKAKEVADAAPPAPDAALVEAEQGPVAFQCHSCKAQTPPPAPFKWYVECKECGEKTAATAAAQPAHPDASVLVEALEHARQFIRNGIDLGFIRMPDADTDDPAHKTLPKIDAALSTYRAALAGKGGE